MVAVHYQWPITWSAYKEDVIPRVETISQELDNETLPATASLAGTQGKSPDLGYIQGRRMEMDWLPANRRPSLRREGSSPTNVPCATSRPAEILPPLPLRGLRDPGSIISRWRGDGLWQTDVAKALGYSDPNATVQVSRCKGRKRFGIPTAGMKYAENQLRHHRSRISDRLVGSLRRSRKPPNSRTGSTKRYLAVDRRKGRVRPGGTREGVPDQRVRCLTRTTRAKSPKSPTLRGRKKLPSSLCRVRTLQVEFGKRTHAEAKRPDWQRSQRQLALKEAEKLRAGSLTVGAAYKSEWSRSGGSTRSPTASPASPLDGCSGSL